LVFSSLVTSEAWSAQPGTLDLTFYAGPTMDGAVWSIGVQGDGRVLIGGTFTEIQSLPRRWIARLNPDNTPDETFVPDPALSGPEGGSVYRLLVLPDSKILMVGDFSWGGGAHRRIVRLDPEGRIDPSFDPGTGAAAPWTLVRRPDGRIIVAGGFDEFNGVPRRNVAQLLPDGQVDSAFDPGPGPDDMVTALLLQADGRLVVGGMFTNWNGRAQPGLVRLNSDGSRDTSFQTGTGVNGIVLSLAQDSENRILVAGFFLDVDGTSYRNLARLNADGSIDYTFSTRLDLRSAVWKIAMLGDGLFLVGGDFTRIESASRIRIARLKADGRLDYTFIHETGAPDATVLDIVPLPDGRVYVGGEFRSFGALRTPPVVRLEANGRLDRTFPATIGADLPASTIGVSPAGRIWLGGDFSFVHGVPRRGLACLYPDGRLDPRVDLPLDTFSGVRALLFGSDDSVIVAGNFTTIGGISQRGIARVCPDDTLDPNFRPAIDGSVLALARQADGRLVIAGGFQSVEGVLRPGVARLESDGTLDPEFAPTLLPNDSVLALCLHASGAVIIGGGFEFINHEHPPFLARYDPSGAADPIFRDNLGPDYDVYTLSPLDAGRLLLAGYFGSYKGTPCGHVVRLNPDGSLDTTFLLTLYSDQPAAATVEPDGRILAYGTFNLFAGEIRPSLVRLMPDGSVDPTFVSPFPVNNAVHTLARQPDGKLIVSGTFLECDGHECIRLARLHGGSPPSSDLRFQPGTIRYESSSGFRVQLAASPGQVVVGERSQDLQSWVPVVTNIVPAAGLVEFVDPTDPASAYCFYRAVTP